MRIKKRPDDLTILTELLLRPLILNRYPFISNATKKYNLKIRSGQNRFEKIIVNVAGQ